MKSLPHLTIESSAQNNQPEPPVWFRIALAAVPLALIALVGSFALGFRPWEALTPKDTLAANELIVALNEKRVQTLTYKTSDGTIVGTYLRNSGDDKPVAFQSTYAGVEHLAETMSHYPQVTYTVDTTNNSWILSAAVIVVPGLFLITYFLNGMRRMSNDQMDQVMGDNKFTKLNALVGEAENPQVKFTDIAGIDKAVEEVKEVYEFLKDPEKYHNMGARIPRGVLLVGPPGTGKTLLAKAVAGEAHVPFFSISGSNFSELYVGVGAARMRNIFKEAKAVAPSIIFIDEVDVIGRQRGAGLGGGNDEREQTLNQMLVEMDGFEDKSSVIVIAATNRPDILDPALLRPGRFDRQIQVDRPDRAGREAILQIHAHNKPLSKEIDFHRWARMTTGFTGADLSKLMNEAAIMAVRNECKEIGLPEMQEALERVIAGNQSPRELMCEAERKIIAYHESGHALVGHVLQPHDPVQKISIVARGSALGYTLHGSEDDRYLPTRSEMLSDLAVLLAGRSAEEVFCHDITTGASNDLERATKTARSMVMRYGMSDTLGLQVFDTANHEVFLGRDYASHKDCSPETAQRIDDEITRILEEAHQEALKVLESRKDQVEGMVRVLLEHESVEGDVLDRLLSDEWSEVVTELCSEHIEE